MFLRKIKFLKKVKYNFLKLIKNDFIITFYKYVVKHRKIPNLKNPKTFNEKIAYCKLNKKFDSYSSLCDKYLVKNHIKEKIGNKYVLHTLLVTSDPNSIDFQALPDSFIIKATHGSGWNIIVRDKNKANIKQIIKKCNFFLSMNYYFFTRERQYINIRPQIMIEKLLIDENGMIPKDYKLFCFSGEVKFIQVDIDRAGSHKRNFYNTEWQKMPFELKNKSYEKDIKEPQNLTEMIEVATILSRGLAFVRIDLYSIFNKVYFGEMTFTPENNLGKFSPKEYDEIIGSYFNINF